VGKDRQLTGRRARGYFLSVTEDNELWYVETPRGFGFFTRHDACVWPTVGRYLFRYRAAPRRRAPRA